MESNSLYCQPHLLWSRANIHYSYSDFGSNRILSPATLLWMELLFVKDHNIFPNESDYFINAHQGSVLCRGISNLLSYLLQSRNHCWRSRTSVCFPGPKVTEFSPTHNQTQNFWLIAEIFWDGWELSSFPKLRLCPDLLAQHLPRWHALEFGGSNIGPG